MTTITKPLKKRFQIGDAVTFVLGGAPIEGLIAEDRGPLGIGGRRVYRLWISEPPVEPIAFELPENELTPESVAAPTHKPLEAARRKLFSEMANVVVQKWWSMPVGGLVPVDHLQGYQGLAKAVFDACREVAQQVSREGVELAKALGLDSHAIAAREAVAVAEAQQQALRVSQYAREKGFDGLHREIEKALRDMAVAGRDRLLRVADERGWQTFESALRDREFLGTRYPLLALLAE